jgi:hypothetical protein
MTAIMELQAGRGGGWSKPWSMDLLMLMLMLEDVGSQLASEDEGR